MGLLITPSGGGSGAGDVVGPAFSTDNTIARFDGTTGKLIQGYTSGAPTIGDTGDVLLAGTFSVPGAGTDSLRLGPTTTAAGTSAIAIGATATATGNYSVVVGYGSSTAASGGLGQGAVVVGYNIDLVGADSVAIGYQAVAAGITSVAIGSGSSAGSDPTATDNTVIGDDAKVLLSTAVAVTLIGRGATSLSSSVVAIGSSPDIGTSSSNSIAIGADAQIGDNHGDSVIFGRAAATTAGSQFIVGSSAAPIRNVYIGEGVTSTGTPLAAKWHQANATGTNISTPDWEFNTGISTGTGTGGQYIFRTTAAGASGAGANSLTARLTLGANATFSGSITATALTALVWSGKTLTLASPPLDAVVARAAQVSILHLGTTSAGSATGDEVSIDFTWQGTYASGRISAYGQSNGGGTGGLKFYTSNSGSTTYNATPALTLDKDNNVGFGITPTARLTIVDAGHIAVGTGTGTKIGTATSQKIAFYNATPIVQGASVADATDAASAITQLNALISRIEATGLIATV